MTQPKIATSELSLDRPQTGHAEPASAAKVKARTSLKILMIEDDEGDAYLIERALRSNARVGEVVRARDGVEAVDMIDHHGFRPDLALVDLQMPRKDGFSLLLELGLRVTVDFPAVVLSTSRAGADRVRARTRGSAHFITKPASLEKMTRALDEVIARI
jgi:CheY-like chemotaxis protein